MSFGHGHSHYRNHRAKTSSKSNKNKVCERRRFYDATSWKATTRKTPKYSGNRLIYDYPLRETEFYPIFSNDVISKNVGGAPRTITKETRMKFTRTKIATAIALTIALAGTTAGASAAPVLASAPESKIVASQAFAAAGADGDEGVVSPQAIPAVVATAFVTGAAGAAGAYVGNWVAKKITGIWSVQQEVQDPTIFD
jgi:hypothetical protein